MSPGFGGIVFQNGEAAGEMDLFWILISCCNSTIYRFFCLRLVKFLSEKLSQKSTFTGKINPLNFLKSLNLVAVQFALRVIPLALFTITSTHSVHP